MGRLVYDGVVRFVIDDRTLAHLQVVIGEKLRRRESFAFTWASPLDEGGGRMSVWINPNSALAFTFERPGPYRFHRAWLDALSTAAHSGAGLHNVPEPVAGKDTA